MSRYRFEILLPVYHNDMRSVDVVKIANAKRMILNEFGGCRASMIPLEGYWQSAGVEYEDSVIHIIVETDKSATVIEWFRDRKIFWESEKQFDQELIYITYHELKTLG